MLPGVMMILNVDVLFNDYAEFYEEGTSEGNDNTVPLSRRRQ